MPLKIFYISIYYVPVRKIISDSSKKFVVIYFLKYSNFIDQHKINNKIKNKKNILRLLSLN